MAIQTSVNRRTQIDNEDDEEINETEDNLIENYLYLTHRCGVLRHSPTSSALEQLQHRQHPHPPILSRQFSCNTKDSHLESEHSYHLTKSYSTCSSFETHHHSRDYLINSRVPPTVYYNVNDDYDETNSFSLVKLFARMKTRLKHDRRYRPTSNHELLHEEYVPEWYELTKNLPSILKKVLLPDGGCDAFNNQNKTTYYRRNSQKKSRDYRPVGSSAIDDDDHDDAGKIHFEIDDEFNTEGDEEFDRVIWENFRQCSRGSNYRRCGVCKVLDRQQYQGQLVYIYGIANNILIDENLKASGLG